MEIDQGRNTIKKVGWNLDKVQINGLFHAPLIVIISEGSLGNPHRSQPLPGSHPSWSMRLFTCSSPFKLPFPSILISLLNFLFSMPTSSRHLNDNSPVFWFHFYSFFLLGLLQRDHPGIAVSVKTRQAIRTVLNHSRDTIHELQGAGLLDEMEAHKLEMASSTLLFV